jgi:short-subunit dehydrogenase
MKTYGKVIVVTGAGSGIGKELVLQLLKKDASVAAVDLNPVSLNELVAIASNGRLATFVCDISQRTEVEHLSEKVLEHFGAVDGIINNAGIIQPFVKVNDLSFETIEKVMQVNFYGSLYMIKTFLPHLLTRSEGHIVNISSMGGFLPVPGQSVYGASKAALKLLTEGLYAELLDTHVRVTIVFPGAIDTNIVQNSGVEMEKPDPSTMLSATAAAQQIIDAMGKNKFRSLVGKDAQFLDRIYRLMPKQAVHMITRKMKGLLRNS